MEKSGTYLKLLQYLNTPEATSANASWYAIFAGHGQSSDNAGAALVAGWYVRNTFIFSNVLNTIKPGDRVGIFMGQGNAYLLHGFIRLNPNLVDIDPVPYLK